MTSSPQLLDPRGLAQKQLREWRLLRRLEQWQDSAAAARLAGDTPAGLGSCAGVSAPDRAAAPRVLTPRAACPVPAQEVARCQATDGRSSLPQVAATYAGLRAGYREEYVLYNLAAAALAQARRTLCFPPSTASYPSRASVPSQHTWNFGPREHACEAKGLPTLLNPNAPVIPPGACRV